MDIKISSQWLFSPKQAMMTLKQLLLPFPHSNITAKMMTLNRMKSMYAINHGLAPFFKPVLMSDLQKSGIHTQGSTNCAHCV